MSGLKRLKAAAMCGAGASFDAGEVEQLAELITEHDGVECTKHDAIARGAVQRAQELEAQLAGARAMADCLEKAGRSLTERLKQSEARMRELKRAAEKVYQLRSEAPAGDKFVEFYNALIRLGHALKDL